MIQFHFKLMAMSKCNFCGEVLPSSAFYVSNQTKCKDCIKSAVRANREANLEYYQEFDRQRGRTPGRKKKNLEHYHKKINDPEWKAARWADRKRWAERNKEARAAHIVVGNAIRDDRLKKEPCVICGKFPVHAHHEDYSEPLVVVWLCREHHGMIHRK